MGKPKSNFGSVHCLSTKWRPHKQANLEQSSLQSLTQSINESFRLPNTSGPLFRPPLPQVDPPQSPQTQAPVKLSSGACEISGCLQLWPKCDENTVRQRGGSLSQL